MIPNRGRKDKSFEKIYLITTDDLVQSLLEIKKGGNFGSWNAMFSHILSVNKRPENLVKKYRRSFDSGKRKVFQASVSPHVMLQFKTWCAPFSGQADAVDYLVAVNSRRNKFSFLENL